MKHSRFLRSLKYICKFTFNISNGSGLKIEGLSYNHEWNKKNIENDLIMISTASAVHTEHFNILREAMTWIRVNFYGNEAVIFVVFVYFFIHENESPNVLISQPFSFLSTLSVFYLQHFWSVSLSLHFLFSYKGLRQTIKAQFKFRGVCVWKWAVASW